MGKSDFLDERELRAAAAMILTLGGDGWVVVPRDVKGAPDKTHDFDLVDEDSTIAVEISTIARTEAVRDHARWSREFPGGIATFQRLKSGWMILAEASADGTSVKRSVGDWLGALETLGVDSLDTDSFQRFFLEPPPSRPSWYETALEMRQAGVLHVEKTAELTSGQVAVASVAPTPTYTLSDADYVSRFVSEQLHGPHASDIRKLNPSPAARRALFLWIDPQSHLELIRALEHDLLQGDVTGMGKVEEIWLGRKFQNGTVIVYRWIAANSWQTLSFEEAELEVVLALLPSASS